MWKDFESSSEVVVFKDLTAWFCATDDVSDQAVKWGPVGLKRPWKEPEPVKCCCSSYMLCTFKGFAALPPPNIDDHSQCILMPTSLSCTPLTAHLEQQMHSKACIGPIIRWTSKIYMCHGQTEGRLLPCLGTVSILYDYSILLHLSQMNGSQYFNDETSSWELGWPFSV